MLLPLHVIYLCFNCVPSALCSYRYCIMEMFSLKMKKMEKAFHLCRFSQAAAVHKLSLRPQSYCFHWTFSLENNKLSPL